MRSFKLILTAFLLYMALLFVACSGDSGVAGIFIETNTGNKVLIETNTGNGFARMYITTSAYNLSVGDTLQLTRADMDTVGDTVYVSRYEYQKVVDSVAVAIDIMELDSVPSGGYDSVTVRPVEGEVRIVPVQWNIVDDKVNYDEPMQERLQVSVDITLPEEWQDLASAEESFKDMPLPIRIPTVLKNPCLIDANENVIPLGRVAVAEPSSEDPVLYWAKLPQVIFNESGAISFKVLDGCRTTDSLDFELSRRTVHFDDSLPGAFGGARWTDSTDGGYLINDFKPFVDGKSMTASIWLNMDSTAQAAPAKSYTRILSAKKDSVGFIVQQRDSLGSINLRLDARINGVGDYSKTFGKVDIMDGQWHNYAFTIDGDSVKVYFDGALLQKAEFDSGEGFATAYNPVVGNQSPNMVGGVDEIFFFDGKQSENWMHLFYALQKSALKPALK